MEFLKKRLPALLLAMLMLLSACGKKDDENEGEEEEYFVGDQVVQQTSAEDNVFSLNFDTDGGLNPLNAASSNNMLFWSLMYDSVYVVENDFSVTSEIVKEYETSDYEWWVFDIYDNITFHDGTPLTATIEGVEEQGALLLRHADSSLHSYQFKEVEFVIKSDR